MSPQLADILRVRDDVQMVYSEIRAAAWADGQHDERLLKWAGDLGHLLRYYLPDIERREVAS